MKLLLLGANGQVGWELQRSLAPLGELKACDREEANLEDAESLTSLIDNYKPEIIVNAAAYTSVDKSESEPEKSFRINAKAVGLLAHEIKKINGWLIHYSSDYVFDGTKKTPYLEKDQTNPLSVYGKSKLEGEKQIIRSGCNHLIFRTSWVYAVRGNNFAKKIIKLAKFNNEIKVVSDQIGTPTSAELIADISAFCLYKVILDTTKKNLKGIYNLTPTGETSWLEYAQFVVKEAQKRDGELKITSEKIIPIKTKDYPLPAIRPANSRLNTQKIRNAFKIYLPPWQMNLVRMIKEIYSQ